MKKYLYIWLFLVSCKVTDNLTGETSIRGVIKTCETDSTSFFNSVSLVLDLKNKECNMDCSNRPLFTSPYKEWPSNVWLDFDEHTFVLTTNVKNEYKANTQLVAQMHIMPIFGKMKFNKKNGTIRFKIKQYHWQKKFAVVYNTTDSLITLTEK